MVFSHYTYVIKDGVRRDLKNLGWMLRNWQDVGKVEFRYREKSQDHELIAYLKSGGEYHSSFADLTVFWDWINRPVFRGLQLIVVDADRSASIFYTIGSPVFPSFRKLDWRKQVDSILARK